MCFQSTFRWQVAVLIHENRFRMYTINVPESTIGDFHRQLECLKAQNGGTSIFRGYCPLNRWNFPIICTVKKKIINKSVF